MPGYSFASGPSTGGTQPKCSAGEISRDSPGRPQEPGDVGDRVARVVEFAQHDLGALAESGARFREKYALARAGTTTCATFVRAG